MLLRSGKALLAIAIVAILVGCAKASIIGDRTDIRKVDDEPYKTIVVWHTYSDQETRVFEERVIPAFEAANPSIRIESVRQEHNEEYQAALIAKMSAGKIPDVVRMDYSWVSSFASKQLLYPLSEFPDFAETAAPLQGKMLETNRYGGEYYGLPLNITTKAAIFNRSLFEKTGLDPSSWSLTEVAEAAREQGVTLGMGGIKLWYSLPYFLGFGGMLADDSFTQAKGYINSEASVEAVKKMLELHREGIINPRLLSGGADLWNDVLAARVLMIDEGPWFYSILLHSKEVKDDVLEKTVPIPFPTDGTYGSVIGGENLVMAQGSRYKEEAWTFIRWMMRKETQWMMLEAGLIPTNQEALEESKAVLEHHPYLAAYMQGIEHGFYFPAIPQWGTIEQIYEDALLSIFLDGKDVRQALNEAAAAMDDVLR